MLFNFFPIEKTTSSSLADYQSAQAVDHIDFHDCHSVVGCQSPKSLAGLGWACDTGVSKANEQAMYEGQAIANKTPQQC